MTALERIMHIEDDPAIQEVARVALEVVGGFTVRSCDSGAAGVAAADSFAPQLVLLDVMMPGMDGPQTLAELRKLPVMKDVPVVFMTAKAQTQEVTAYRALGAAGVIIKPFDPMTLSEQIRAIWEQHNIPVDFVVSKHMLPDVKAKFVADVYYHIGDREDLDRKPALDAGFEFLWPDEAALEPWLSPGGNTGTVNT